MRVAHQSDHITHAVIGANAAMNFGISDDPAFFQILSQSLYKNPTLAMVRETICNAWDAHIAAGLQDTPIKISLDDDNLIIEDFGPGIPKDLIQPIYGVYGASTKKNDGRQTGGFGLGCKSPFSYNDHFEVTSCHGGTKTIYSMSRSSAKVDGKPSIQPIASFPTTETGIKVRIPINPTQRENANLRKYINQVVFGGDIKAIFNNSEELLPVLGLDTSDYGIVLINQNERLAGLGSRVKLRYGNVLYPVEPNDQYAEELSRVIRVANRHYEAGIIIQAQPDTISVTPSRESLTLSDMTIKTIKELLVNFLIAFQNSQAISDRKNELVHEAVLGAVEHDRGWFTRQLSRAFGEWKVPGFSNNYTFNVLRTEDDFADMRANMELSRERLDSKTWLKNFTKYVSGVLADGFIDKQKYASWLKVARQNIKHLRNPNTYQTSRSEIRVATRWWYEHIGLPMMAQFEKHVPGFNLKHLSYRNGNNGGHYYNGVPLSMRSVRIQYHTGNFAMMEAPLIVLSYNRDTVDTRMRYKHRHGELLSPVQQTNYFHYEISKRKGHLEEVLEAIAKMDGVYVIDLTGRLPHEEREYQERAARALARKAELAAGATPNKRGARGMVRLDQLATPEGAYYMPKWHDLNNPEKLLKPEFYVHISLGQNMQYRPNQMSKENIRDVIALYGERGGVTPSAPMCQRYEKEHGTKYIWTFLAEEIGNDLLNWSLYKKHLGFSWTKIQKFVEKHAGWYRKNDIISIMKFFRDHPQFSVVVPSGPELTDTERAKLRLWNDVSNHISTTPVMDQLHRLDLSIPLDPTLETFITKLCSNPYLDTINFDVIENKLKQSKADPNIQPKKLIEMVSAIL